MKRLLKSKPFWSSIALIASVINSGFFIITNYPGFFFYPHLAIFIVIIGFMYWQHRTPYRFLAFSFGHQYHHIGGNEEAESWCKENKIIFFRSYNTYYFLRKTSLMAFKLRFVGEE